MLEIALPTQELFDEETETFSIVAVTLQLEHSLVSMSKWESKFSKPFLSKEEKTTEEILDYIRMMIISPDTKYDVINFLTSENIRTINDYINSKQTATTIYKTDTGKPSRETITSELIYYWMVALTIPFECQYWHLNRLLTLIEVCNVKNQPPKKVAKGDQARRIRELNEQRRKQLGTAG